MNKHIPRQAVILAAGKCTRFVPFNDRLTHKSNYILMGKPIIIRTLAALEKAGIKQTIVVISPHDYDLKTTLLSYKQSRMNLVILTQFQPLGMANALLQAKEYLEKRFLVINPQQVNLDEQLKLITNDPLILFTQTTNHPEKYGIVCLDGNRVTGVLEKPSSSNSASSQRILGIYILTLDLINFLAKIDAQEYQLESALSQYTSHERIIAINSSLPSYSLKYSWDLFSIAHNIFSESPREVYIHDTAIIHPTAIITGPVIIDASVTIHEYAIIQGPCYIGQNTIVGSYCKLRQETILEADVQLQHQVEVKHSIIGNGTHIHSGYVGDTIIGKHTRIGAGFITANRRLDRADIKVSVDHQLIPTNTSYFGSLIGDHVNIGIHCGTNPGTIITSNQSILPMTIT